MQVYDILDIINTLRRNALDVKLFRFTERIMKQMNNLMKLEAAAATAEGGTLSLIFVLLIYGVFFLAMYLIFFRPQSKKKKKEAEMRKNAQVGDEITTIGGICGRIVAVKDESDSVVIETGSDKAKMRVKRWAIGSVDTVHEDE